MSRVKISEYKAKKLLLGDRHKGIQLRSGETMEIPSGRWVAKVDQGIKKRAKQGLLLADKPVAEIRAAIKSWEAKGFSQFILEPLLPYEKKAEQYFSLERIREGIRMLHTPDGGINIEEHPENVQTYMISNDTEVSDVAKRSGVPEEFLSHALDVFEKNMFAFLEINPLVILGRNVHILDAAVLVDSAGEFFVRGAWTESDVIKARSKHAAETAVEELAATTPASLKLSVINQEGSLFFLLSGGGGSIVIADEAQLEGMGKEMGNYGEYSGGPTREETYLYAKEVITLMLNSSASKKALVVAGGVANFTDVKKTFLGIIDALSEKANELRRANVRVFVRRGGPNEAAGLALMREFLEKEDLLGSVHGSDNLITSAVDDAMRYTRV